MQPVQPIVLGLAIATFAATLLGGAAALRLRKDLRYFFAFAAGTLVAVSFLDLLPESLDLAADRGLAMRTMLLIVVGSFFAYSLLERIFATHHEHGEDQPEHGHLMGPVAAGSLVLHSFLDGAAIGAAFQASEAAGLLVAFAVVAHDFTDGINTVTLMVKNQQKRRRTIKFLLADAVAPVLGVGLTLFLDLDFWLLPVLLAVFVGEFLYLGASHLLPETYRSGKPRRMVAAMAAGIVIIAALTTVLAA
ncbi:MAG: ZIP family metal transporter [Halobacteriales archaeon]|nr:ZIP family metal transporter [Halobacteriales archaeon]